jgi:molybdate transport system substrate-binding protein
MARFARMVAFVLAALIVSPAQAAETSIAVAANFADAAKEIAGLWERKTGHKAIFSFGATGALFTQIHQGAPFDIFLAADQATVKRAAQEGLGLAATQFTYAIGKLVLFSKTKGAVGGEQTLKDAKFARIAIANPAAAPYGAAAIDVMKRIGVYESLTPKIVQGQNITQTYQFVETGNAELGFVALSQVAGTQDGSRWIVPQSLYTPINQDAILLKRGERSAAAQDFIAFLKGPEATQVKEKYGYGPGL